MVWSRKMRSEHRFKKFGHEDQTVEPTLLVVL